MKRFGAMVLILLALILFGAALSGFAKTDSPGGGKLSVVCTTFPQYDWTRQILGDRADDVELTLLLDSGVDLHSFQPSADDIIKISACDLFVYVGGESDAWVEDALRNGSNPRRIAIDLLETLGTGAKAEEIVEGMEEEAEGHEHEGEAGHEGEDEHEHEGEAGHEGEDEDEHEHEHGEGVVYDEHVWLSPRNAAIFCDAISRALASLDAEHADVYAGNLARCREGLADLDAAYRAAIEAAPVRTLLFGDRFPFRYLADDYGLTYYAAFPGCSAETEASFETVVFLADKADELGLKTVMAIEGSDGAIAKTIVANTAGKDQRILTLDSMQSVTADDVQKGATYLSIMESNLDVLREALE